MPKFKVSKENDKLSYLYDLETDIPQELHDAINTFLGILSFKGRISCVKRNEIVEVYCYNNATHDNQIVQQLNGQLVVGISGAPVADFSKLKLDDMLQVINNNIDYDVVVKYFSYGDDLARRERLKGDATQVFNLMLYLFPTDSERSSDVAWLLKVLAQNFADSLEIMPTRIEEASDFLRVSDINATAKQTLQTRIAKTRLVATNQAKHKAPPQVPPNKPIHFSTQRHVVEFIKLIQNKTATAAEIMRGFVTADKKDIIAQTSKAQAIAIFVRLMPIYAVSERTTIYEKDRNRARIFNKYAPVRDVLPKFLVDLLLAHRISAKELTAALNVAQLPRLVELLRYALTQYTQDPSFALQSQTLEQLISDLDKFLQNNRSVDNPLQARRIDERMNDTSMMAVDPFGLAPFTIHYQLKSKKHEAHDKIEIDDGLFDVLEQKVATATSPAQVVYQDDLGVKHRLLHAESDTWYEYGLIPTSSDKGVSKQYSLDGVGFVLFTKKGDVEVAVPIVWIEIKGTTPVLHAKETSIELVDDSINPDGTVSSKYRYANTLKEMLRLLPNEKPNPSPKLRE